MKKTVVFLILMLCTIISFAQQLDGYNKVFLNSKTNNQWGLDDRIKASFMNKGFEVFTNKEQIPKDKKSRLATLELTYEFEIKYGGSPFKYILTNMLGEVVFEAEGVGNTLSAKADANRACERALKKMEELSYNYDPEKTPKVLEYETDKSSWDENEVKQYLESSSNPIEGIYKNIGGNYFKLAILKENNVFLALVLDTDNENWNKGDIKAEFELIRDNFYNTTYYSDNYKKIDTISELNENGVIQIGESRYMKLYPINR